MKYDHHPDPAIAFCIEADIIEAIYHDVRIGLTRREALESRVERAMQFRVGGDASAIAAKDRIREIDAALRGRQSYQDVPSRAATNLQETQTRIVAAALRKGDEVRSLPAPARHHHIISEMNCAGIKPHDWEQGFLGDDGEFYTRFQAWQRAYRAGQTTVRHNPPELYSEDLW